MSQITIMGENFASLQFFNLTGYLLILPKTSPDAGQKRTYYYLLYNIGLIKLSGGDSKCKLILQEALCMARNIKY